MSSSGGKSAVRWEFRCAALHSHGVHLCRSCHIISCSELTGIVPISEIRKFTLRLQSSCHNQNTNKQRRTGVFNFAFCVRSCKVVQKRKKSFFLPSLPLKKYLKLWLAYKSAPAMHWTLCRYALKGNQFVCKQMGGEAGGMCPNRIRDWTE